MAISGTQQAGHTIDAGATHAALWSGTAASYINLHPSMAFDSSALSTSGRHQVGWVMYAPGVTSAVFWSGTAESVFNPQSVLPSDYDYSEARSIFESGGSIYVAGHAHNLTLGRPEAILWTLVVPEPSVFLLYLSAVGLIAVSRAARSLSRPQ